jgi:hypothetical protein
MRKDIGVRVAVFFGVPVFLYGNDEDIGIGVLENAPFADDAPPPGSGTDNDVLPFAYGYFVFNALQFFFGHVNHRLIGPDRIIIPFFLPNIRTISALYANKTNLYTCVFDHIMKVLFNTQIVDKSKYTVFFVDFMHDFIHIIHILIPKGRLPENFRQVLSRNLSTLSTFLHMQIFQVYIIFKKQNKPRRACYA